jgi:hypothetical protein
MLSTLVEEDDTAMDEFVKAGCSQDVALLNIFQRKVADGVIISLKNRRLVEQETAAVASSGTGSKGHHEQPYRDHPAVSATTSPAAPVVVTTLPLPIINRSRQPFSAQQGHSEPGTPTSLSPCSQPDLASDYRAYGGSYGYVHDSRVHEQVQQLRPQRGIASSEQEEEMELDMLISRGFTRAEAIRMFLANKQQQQSRVLPSTQNVSDYSSHLFFLCVFSLIRMSLLL